jgi:hypothetical protein
VSKLRRGSVSQQFVVGDAWRDGYCTRTLLAVYDRDVLVVCEPFDGDRSTLSLPKRLFTEGRCGCFVGNSTLDADNGSVRS